MAKKIEYLDGARSDFDESFDWYAQRSVGAALGFATSVDDSLERIVAELSRFAMTRGRCRYCSLKRYPFRIVYREKDDCIVVVAIAHAKRRPSYWRRRI